MNCSIREIYADYQYEMLKVGLALRELAQAGAMAPDRVEPLLAKAERLEALIDVYAYLLACQGHGQRL